MKEKIKSISLNLTEYKIINILLNYDDNDKIADVIFDSSSDFSKAKSYLILSRLYKKGIIEIKKPRGQNKTIYIPTKYGKALRDVFEMRLERVDEALSTS